MSEFSGDFRPDYEHDSKFRYTVIPNDLLRDKTISPSCRWLICYLSSNSPNWVVKARQIINHCEGFMGRDQIYAIINEAIEAGYMFREETTVKGLKRVFYKISTDKRFKISLPRPENQDTERQDTVDQDAQELPSPKNYHQEESSSSSVPPKKSSKSPEGLEEWMKRMISLGWTEEECREAYGRYLVKPSGSIKNPRKWLETVLQSVRDSNSKETHLKEVQKEKESQRKAKEESTKKAELLRNKGLRDRIDSNKSLAKTFEGHSWITLHEKYVKLRWMGIDGEQLSNVVSYEDESFRDMIKNVLSSAQMSQCT